MGKKKHKKKQKNKRKGQLFGFNLFKNLHTEENVSPKHKQQIQGNTYIYYCMPCDQFLAYSLDQSKVNHCPDCKGGKDFYHVGKKTLNMKSLKK